MKRLCLALVATILISGCASISYKPTVSLPDSPKTINARVKVEILVDKTPEEDKDSKVGGVSATAPGTLAGELGFEVTDAILVDFNNNQVFQEIKKRIENPDLIIKGSINRFYGKAGINELGWITLPIDIIWLLGLPIQTEEGMVDITVSVSKPNGTLVAEYNGKSEYTDTYSMYNNVTLNVPSKLNKSFSVAIKQIRDKMMEDEIRLINASKN